MKPYVALLLAFSLAACQTLPPPPDDAGTGSPPEAPAGALAPEQPAPVAGPAWPQVRAEVLRALTAASLDATEMPDGSLKLTLPGEAVFGSGSIAIRNSFQSSLDRIAMALHTHPLTLIHIVGHTDNRGNDQINQDLSQRRAQAVMNHLIGRGIPFTRLRAEGVGATRPLGDNAGEEGRARNRRVELFVEPQPR